MDPIALKCPRCGIGVDDDRDGRCRICARWSEKECAFHRWWMQLTREGDPERIPNKLLRGFNEGWEAHDEAVRNGLYGR